jgi:hypothetical protein
MNSARDGFQDWPVGLWGWPTHHPLVDAVGVVVQTVKRDAAVVSPVDACRVLLAVMFDTEWICSDLVIVWFLSGRVAVAVAVRLPTRIRVQCPIRAVRPCQPPLVVARQSVRPPNRRGS